MSINRDEALRAIDLAEGLMKKNDYNAARKLAMKAQKMDSSLENISRMIMVCDVHCAATEKLGNEMDWYGILQVEQSANDIIIKKQYKRLALLLHPDKNKLHGAESAFKLIGEAQRILLDSQKRMLHDFQRKTWRKPAPPPLYKPQHVPRYTHPKASVNMRNIFTELRPENRHPYQKPQAQPAAYRTTFWTACPYCLTRYEFHLEHINKEVLCQPCAKRFAAFEAPPAKSSRQTTHPFPQQNIFPDQKACSESDKRPKNPATVPARKRSSPMPNFTAKNNGKKRRKNMIEDSESSDDESSSESEDVITDDTMAARYMESNGGEQPRRSVRSKRKVSYNENVGDDDVDVVNPNGEGPRKSTDIEGEEEPEEEKQTHENRSSAEGINTKEKIKEDPVENSSSVSDSAEDLSSSSAAKPNLINYSDPDFNDFDAKFREKSCFENGQIWAVYDDNDGMPRFYALIKKVRTRDFMLKYVWLEVDDDEENETPNLPVSVGKFEVGNEEQTNGNMFSHLVFSKTRSRARKFKVFPRKGETWALFKNWDVKLSADSDSPPKYEYEYVEILSDHEEGSPISVGYLSKVEGFSCVFCPMPKDGLENICEIPPQEFYRFSHSIPSFRLKGTEGEGVTEGWYELDPAALPASQNESGKEAAQNEDHQSPLSGSTC